MTTAPVRNPVPESPALHARAMDNLAFIRDTMERASAFTAVSGWGMVGVGVLAAAVVIALPFSPLSPRWTLSWVATAALGVVISTAATAHKARRASVPLFSGPAQKLLLAFTPAMIVGVLLTVVLFRAGVTALIPGTWLLLYGVAVVGGGVFSVRIVPVMGACFMIAGALALFASPAVAVALMESAFPVLHIGFGVAIARGHGG